MTAARLKLARRDAIVMHPGPIIRGTGAGRPKWRTVRKSMIIDEIHKWRSYAHGDPGAALGKG